MDGPWMYVLLIGGIFGLWYLYTHYDDWAALKSSGNEPTNDVPPGDPGDTPPGGTALPGTQNDMSQNNKPFNNNKGKKHGADLHKKVNKTSNKL